MTIPVGTSNNAASKRNEYSNLKDDKLLFLIGEKRDCVALTEIYKRYKNSLGNFLQRGMYDTILIEDIYNDVMLTIWQKASGFRGESKVSTWIFAIAYRVRMAHTRKENRHAHISVDELTHDIALEADGALGETVQAAMLKLSEQHRAVIELAYFHGYSTSEIAAIVDCPQNTVKTRLFHARQNMKATFNADQSIMGSD